MRSGIFAPEPDDPDPETRRAWEAWVSMIELTQSDQGKHGKILLFSHLWSTLPRRQARERTHRFLCKWLDEHAREGLKDSPELDSVRGWLNEAGNQILADLFVDPKEESQ